MSSPLLEIRGLEKIYDNGVHALRNVSFAVERGEFLVVIGLSGSGKSTLLRCINRLVEPTSGSILFQGLDLTLLDAGALRQARREIGMIFQQFNLVKRKSVLTNVLTGRLAETPTWVSLTGRFSSADRERALHCLDLVGLREAADQRADQLSGGQQQRVAIARTLLQDPQILLADEPVASLDPATSHSVMRYLADANQKMGKTILCNLHFLSLVRAYATRVIALKAGELVFEGRPDQIDEGWFRRIYGEDAREVRID
jgi:phosphonate transport system ATP-binding protein